MALFKARIIAVGETPYAHEREGIEFAEKALPDTDPYHLWALVDLLDPSTGRQHELDLVILGYACLYLVELKAYPGVIEGDAVDWIWVTPEGRRLWRDNPRGLAKRKAQILKSRLERALPSGVRAPWVEPLIFLSYPEVKLGLQPDGLMGWCAATTSSRRSRGTSSRAPIRGIWGVRSTGRRCARWSRR